MSDTATSLWTWVRSKIEISAVISIVVGVSTYVGDVFYQAYFRFYNVDGAGIKIPLLDGIRTFAIILIVSVCLISLIASAKLRTETSFFRALLDNVPLFIVLVFVCGWAIGFYWQNVDTLSSWLAALVKDQRLQEENRLLTLQVTHFLRRAILIAPFLIAAATVVSLSAFRLSLSGYLMRGAVSVRLFFLALYTIFALSMAGACGKAFAFLEFTGAFERPELAITLDDGKMFQEGSSLYLLAETDSALYVARRPIGQDTTVRTWLVAKSNIKNIEFRAAPLNPKPFIDYLESD